MKLWQQIGLGLAGAVSGLLLAVRKTSTAADPAPKKPGSGSIDGYAPKETTALGQCSLTEKPGVAAFRTYWVGQFGLRPGSPGNILRDCSTGSPSEHWEGRAWDWMIPGATQAERDANAKAALDILLATDGEGNPHSLLRRAGVMYVIWNRKMWRAYDHPVGTRTWTPYTGPDPHTDHVHFSFSWAGARGETSFYRDGLIA